MKPSQITTNRWLISIAKWLFSCFTHIKTKMAVVHDEPRASRPVVLSKSHRSRALAASSFAWAKFSSPGPRFHAKCAWGRSLGINTINKWEKKGHFRKGSIFRLICMHACMHACMHVCMYLCIYVSLYVCMYVCMHENKCIYQYIYT